MPGILNFYELLNVPRSSTCEQLSKVISDWDEKLDNAGLDNHDPRRKNIALAYAVLCSEDKRRVYDSYLDSGRYLSVGQLESLGNFGQLPSDAPSNQSVGMGPALATAPGPALATAPGPASAAQPGPVDPFAQPDYSSAQLAQMHNEQLERKMRAAQRANWGTRMLMHLMDLAVPTISVPIIMLVLDELVGFIPGVAAESIPVVLGTTIAGALFAAYFVIGDITCGTLAKRMMGYRVQDATTGKKLSLGQSLKRNWVRGLSVIPLVGWLATAAASLPLALTIKPSRGQVGTHDALAGAEVVKQLPPGER